MYFLISAVLEDQFSSFTEFDNMYQEAVRQYLPEIREPKTAETLAFSTKLEQYKLKLTEIYTKRAACDQIHELVVSDIIDEFICMHEIFLIIRDAAVTDTRKAHEDKTKKLEKLAILYYIKFLANYYSIYASISAEVIKKNSGTSGEMKQLAKKLRFMSWMLDHYANEPHFSDLFAPLQKLYEQENPKNGETENQKRRRENFRNMMEEFNVSSSDFIKWLLPESILPNPKIRCIQYDKIDQMRKRFIEFKLFDPDRGKGKTGSRINKMIQVLMESDGWNVIKSGEGTTSKSNQDDDKFEPRCAPGPSDSQPEASTSA